jgi:hypothetical protein
MSDCRRHRPSVHKHLRRLEGIWIAAPIYFLTTCTRNRRPLLARDEVAKILIDEWRSAQESEDQLAWPAAVDARGYNAVATRILRSRSALDRELFRKVELR